MGNDGGSMPHREDLIKEKPKEKKADQTLLAYNKSHICTLSSQNLIKPIVADRAGNLFTKEVVLEALVNKSMPRSYCYIRKVKDVKTLNIITKDPENDKITSDGKSQLNSFIILTSISRWKIKFDSLPNFRNRIRWLP